MHESVLLKEVIDGLKIDPNDVVVDGTLGNAGHSKEIVEMLGKEGVLIGIDHDKDALDYSEEILKDSLPKIHLVEGNFRNIKEIVSSLGYQSVTKILLDLGLRSTQIEESGRGFSFKRDEPLYMTFSKDFNGKLTASEIVNEWGEDTLSEIIKGYGEERYARRIARGIVEARAEGEIKTTSDLTEIISRCVPGPYRNGRIHPATRTFQALRIAVNDEIEALRQVLQDGFEVLGNGGRFAVISFHSLEDRIVKHFFKNNSEARVENRKPIIPSEKEIKENTRSRSAKLRIAEKQTL